MYFSPGLPIHFYLDLETVLRFFRIFPCLSLYLQNVHSYIVCIVQTLGFYLSYYVQRLWYEIVLLPLFDIYRCCLLTQFVYIILLTLHYVLGKR